MKRTVGFLILAFALPGLAQSDPPTAPIANPDPSTANPFVDSVSVTLKAGTNATIYWDTGSTTTYLNPGEGHTYDGSAIVIKGSTTLRTVADYMGMGIGSMPANYAYVRDAKPTISFSSPTANQSFRVGQTVHLAANASDPDGPAPLSVRFLHSSPTGWVELTPSPITTAPYAYDWALDETAPTGLVQLRAIARDGKGATDSVTTTVTVVANKAPTVTLTSPANNSSYIAPASVTLNATASDPDGNVTKVEFYKGGTLLATVASPPYTFGPITLAESTYTFTATAYDNGTPVKTASATAKVTVVKNNPPSVSITFPQNGKTYYAPFVANVAATAADADGGVAKVEFYNGTTLEAGDSTPPNWGYAKTYAAGTYSLTAKATDSLGLSATSAAVAFTVINNQKPTAKTGKDTTIVLPTLSCQLNGSGSSDPEGTALKYKWTGPAGVTFNNDTLANPIATFPANGTGNYAIQLKVTDRPDPASYALSDSVKQTVTIWSKPTITSPTNAAAVANQNFTYTLAATGFPAPTLDAPAASRPAWLTFNASTNSLTGKPTAQGSFNVGLTATNAAGTDSKTLVITVGDSLYKPTITSSLSATAKVGSAFSYVITARGNPSNFTFGASGLPAGLSLSGATIGGTPTASGNFTVTLTAGNSLGSDQKNLALTVNLAPGISKDLPDSLPSILVNGTATFTVQAWGFPSPSYQWQYSGTSSTAGFGPVGTNANSYTINPASLASTGWYRVIVKNGVGPDVTSKACHLQVNPLPAPVIIIQNPTAQVAVVGDKVQFKAKATGEPFPLYYRWYRGYPNRTPLTNATPNDTVFAIDTAKTGLGGLYSVRVTTSNFPGDTTNPSYSAWSDTARLTVQLPKLPKPTANPPGGTIYSPTSVNLSVAVPNAAIWYTLNGADPTESAPSLQYANGMAILIDSTRTLKARAYYSGAYRASDVMAETYTMTARNKSAKPVIGPADSIFTGTLTVTIASPDSGSVFYSIDGSDPALPYPPEGISLSNSAVVKAIARKTGLLESDTAIKVYTLAKPKPKVLNPQLSPDSGSFAGVLLVRITCPTPGAILRYTLDGKDPDSSSSILVGAALPPLTRTTTVKVVGMLQDYGNSDIITRVFRLGPGPITASPAPDSIFEDSLRVKLSVSPSDAVIHFTTDGSQPTDQSPIYPAGGVSFTTTTTLTAIAYLGSQPGNPQTFRYTLKNGSLITPIPLTPNNAATFKDTLMVSLISTPGAAIYYTLDGSEPAIVPGNLYQKPLILDKTTTLEAMAVENGFENSKVLVATYTLVPGKPEMKPPGGSYPLPITVQLTSPSRTANLYYTLDGSTPTPETGHPYKRGDAIRIEFAATLKAVAVAGNMASEVAAETYSATQISDAALPPGQTLYLDGGYTLRNPENEQATAQVHMGSPFSSGLTGFDAVQYTFSLSLAGPAAGAAQAFPKLVFTTPASEKRSLYKVEPSGKIYFVSSSDTVTLATGTYFMGIDTLPPAISYGSESYDDHDSTQVSFTVRDNVANLSYILNRNDDSTRNGTGGQLFSDQIISARLKHPAGTLKPLYVQLIVSDYRQAAYFPGDAHAMLPLSQKLSPLQGPPAWKIGARAGYLYDFVGIPLALNPPLTLDGLRALNPKAAIEGAAYDNASKKFAGMTGSAPLPVGQGFWIAARTAVPSLRLEHAETAPSGGKTAFSIALRKGWNQIANPHLETLYWPYARNLDTYRNFTIKGLWAWDPTLASPDYVQSDSLLPWRGYFVYNYNGDTVVPLLARPATSISPAPPAKAASAARIQMALGWDGRASLRLGADPAARDGLGVEDEEALPQFGSRYLRAMREGRALASDWIKLDRGTVQRWQVEFGSAGDSLPSLRVADLSLPEGDVAWALSPARGMKFPLLPGAEIPASGLARDSLIVVAGPQDKVEALDLVRELSATAPRLDARIAAAADGFRLRLSLPGQARVRATVWSLKGSRLGELSTGLLSEGSYDFAYAGDFSGRPARLGPGMYVLSVDVRGKGVSDRLSRKIYIAR